MPNGDRSDEPTTLGIFGALSALVLCCAIIAVLAFTSGREGERRNQAPASYAQAAKADAQSACVGMESTAAFECIYEKVEASQDQARGEQDLTAQQRAASSALASAFVALLTLIMTGVGVWYIKRTLEATLEAVEDTGRATDTMVKANDIAAAQYQLGFKPWILATATGSFVGDGDISMFKPGEGRRALYVDLRVTLKNISNLPAMITSIQTRWNYYPEQHFRPTDCRVILGPNDEIVFCIDTPYEREVADFRVQEVLNITSDMLLDFRRNAPYLCFVVLYTDPLGIRHELGFAFGPPMLWSKNVRRAGNERENFDRTRPVNDQSYREY